MDLCEAVEQHVCAFGQFLEVKAGAGTAQSLRYLQDGQAYKF